MRRVVTTWAQGMRTALAPVFLPASLAALGVLAGCAAEPKVMRLDAADIDPSARVFPAPQTQEVARYRYIGQLLGETNFHVVNGNRDGMKKLFAIIVGLGERSENPLVLQRPQTGVVDALGRVLVTDVSRNAVFVFDEAAGKLDVWENATPAQRFASPIGIVAAPRGEFLVADSELGRIFRLGADGTPIAEFAAATDLVRPTGMARDAQRGRVFVADTHAHDVKVFDDEGKLLATWGKRGDALGEFNFPTHVAYANGRLVVCDAMNARVQVLDAVTGKPMLQIGQRGMYVGNLVRPKGVAVDDWGNVYVVESMHDTLLVFDAKGEFLLSIGDTGSGVGRFYLPAGVWTDARNRVYVADMFNGRVAVFQFLGGD
jgi:DNA-binding beta-propeller fold protein YncE